MQSNERHSQDIPNHRPARAHASESHAMQLFEPKLYEFSLKPFWTAGRHGSARVLESKSLLIKQASYLVAALKNKICIYVNARLLEEKLTIAPKAVYYILT
jgi:hypothetical protein